MALAKEEKLIEEKTKILKEEELIKENQEEEVRNAEDLFANHVEVENKYINI